MAIKIRFDSNHNPLLPTIILANRNGHRLGRITHISDVHIDAFFNDIDRLTFYVTKEDNSEEDESKRICHLWEKIKDFKLIYCKEWDTWFEIRVELTDGDGITKSVTATALSESELSQVNLYEIEINTETDISREDYTEPTIIYDKDNPEISLLHRITEKVPNYTIAHVDDTLAKLQRTFSFDNIALKDALDEIAEEINALVVYGNGNAIGKTIPARTISLYDLSSVCLNCGYRENQFDICPECQSKNINHGYGKNTKIFVCKDNLTDEVIYTADADSVKNCFRLKAGDDLMTATIRNCNPNGTSYYWSFSDDNKEDMPEELVDKIELYNNTYHYYETEYPVDISNEITDNYNRLIEKYQKFKEDLITVASPIIGYPNLMNAVYDCIDFSLYLEESLMPDTSMSGTDAATQAALLTADNLSPVSVSNIKAISEATANSYVLDIAKVIVDSRYQVSINSSSFNKDTLTWTGDFTVTNYSDEEDTAQSSSVNIAITDNYEQFILQKINKSLSKGDTEDYTLSSLLKKELTVVNDEYSGDFADSIKQYGLSMLTTIHDCCQSCLDVLIEQGIGDKSSWDGSNPNLYEKFYLNYFNKLQALEYEINVRETEIATISTFMDALSDERDKVYEALDFENYLGEDLWKILCSYRREDTYENSNYISDGLTNAELFEKANEFISVAKKEIAKASSPTHQISSTLKNLLVIDEFKKLLDCFEVGNWLRISVDGEVFKLRLLSYSIDFNSLDTIDVEFSDAVKSSGVVHDSQNIFDQASSMVSEFPEVVRQSSKGVNAYNEVNNWREEGLDATLTKIVNTSSNPDVQFDAHGLLFRRFDTATGEYDPIQLRVINSTIVITDDGWKTTRAAIGNFLFKNPETGEFESVYGINAEVLIGRLLLGESLGIYNESGTLTFNQDGLKVTNGINSVVINPNDTNSVFQLLNDEEKVIYFDEDGNAVIRGTIYATDLILASNVNIEGSKVSGLSDVAFSGSYEDLKDAPAAFSGDYNDLTNKPEFSTIALSGDYNDLVNIPEFSDVAFSGDYNDLSNIPNFAAVAFSGKYSDLIDAPSDISGEIDITTLFQKPENHDSATNGQYLSYQDGLGIWVDALDKITSNGNTPVCGKAVYDFAVSKTQDVSDAEKFLYINADGNVTALSIDEVKTLLGIEEMQPISADSLSGIYL